MLVKCLICKFYIKTIPSDFKKYHKECSNIYRTLRANGKAALIKRFNRELTSKDKKTIKFIARYVPGTPTKSLLESQCKYYGSSYKRVKDNIDLIILGEDYDYFKNLDISKKD